jgi:hypothetical protein
MGRHQLEYQGVDVRIMLNGHKLDGRIALGAGYVGRFSNLSLWTEWSYVFRLFAHWSLSDVWQFCMYSSKWFMRINDCIEFGEVNEGIMCKTLRTETASQVVTISRLPNDTALAWLFRHVAMKEAIKSLSTTALWFLSIKCLVSFLSVL